MDKLKRRLKRKKSIRKKITGTGERPRMCITRSNRNLGVQIINDFESRTLCGLTTLSKSLQGKLTAKTKNNIKFAELLGEEIAKVAVEQGIKKVAFDRNGYTYHGVVKALADAARKGGLEF